MHLYTFADRLSPGGVPGGSGVGESLFEWHDNCMQEKKKKKKKRRAG